MLLWSKIGVWWLIAIVILFLDRLSKVWIESSLFFGEKIPVLPFFDLTLHYNAGAGFGFLAQAGGWQRWFFSITAVLVTVGITWRLYKISLKNRWEASSLTLILGGAIGNLYDRLAYGHVVDFLHFHWEAYPIFGITQFPVFNIADIAISLGVIVMFLEGFYVKKNDEEAVS